MFFSNCLNALFFILGPNDSTKFAMILRLSLGAMQCLYCQYSVAIYFVSTKISNLLFVSLCFCMKKKLNHSVSLNQV